MKARRFRKFLCVHVFVIVVSITVAGQSLVTGTVTDGSGARVPKAMVSCVGGSPAVATTDGEGNFSVDPSSCASKRFTVEAAGFGSAIFTVSPSPVAVVLMPRPIDSKVTVTGVSTLVSDSPASIVVVSGDRLRTSPAPTLDDQLRSVPGFSLFRRTGSRTANPTTQGVSLRGVGASGASRAIVLKDGIPQNDPFGSWVYWGRAVQTSISEVEILRGSGGDIYGTSAIGGVIAINTIRPSERGYFSLDGSLGSEATGFASVYGSVPAKAWRASLAGESFRTEGYIPVDVAESGAVDSFANVRRSTVEPLVEFSNRGLRVFASTEFYREVRDNGSPLQTNDTRMNSYSTGADWTTRRFGAFTARIYAGRETYHQSFSAIAGDRMSESLSRLQTVPSRVVGGKFQWTLDGGTNSVFAGVDLREVKGRSDEVGFASGRATSFSNSGGRERTAGYFAGGRLRPFSRITVDLGARYDRWSDLDGVTTTRSLINGSTSIVQYPDRSESAFSPHVGLLFRLNRNISITGNASRSFRQATLNELYRSFRVGNVMTLSNADLRAERGLSGDAGVIVTGLNGRFYLRSSAYCTAIDGPVSNVTLAVTPSLITRQRQNLGATRSCGIEADSEVRVGEHLFFTAGYLHVSSQVVDAGSTSLVGLSVPQVPKDQFTVAANYASPRFGTLVLQLRGSGSQFEDDLNQLPLRGFATADIFFSRPISPQAAIYVAIENVTGTRIEAGRSPVVTLGQPRALRAGFRFLVK